MGAGDRFPRLSLESLVLAGIQLGELEHQADPFTTPRILLTHRYRAFLAYAVEPLT